jgi:hypothetical protein
MRSWSSVTRNEKQLDPKQRRFITELSVDELSNVLPYLKIGATLMLALTCTHINDTIEEAIKHTTPVVFFHDWSITRALKQKHNLNAKDGKVFDSLTEYIQDGDLSTFSNAIVLPYLPFRYVNLYFASFTRLESIQIDFSKTNFTDDYSIPYLPALKRLHLTSGAFDYKRLLEKTPNLEELTLTATCNDSLLLHLIQHTKRLKRVTISHDSFIDDILLLFLSEMPVLHLTLHLSTKLTGQFFANIGKYGSHLQVLEINSRVPSIFLGGGRMKNLHTLKINRPLSHEKETAKNAPNIKILKCSVNLHFTKDELSPLISLLTHKYKRLTSLTIESSSTIAASTIMYALSKNPHLRELYVPSLLFATHELYSYKFPNIRVLSCSFMNDLDWLKALHSVFPNIEVLENRNYITIDNVIDSFVGDPKNWKQLRKYLKEYGAKPLTYRPQVVVSKVPTSLGNFVLDWLYND